MAENTEGTGTAQQAPQPYDAFAIATGGKFKSPLAVEVAAEPEPVVEPAAEVDPVIEPTAEAEVEPAAGEVGAEPVVATAEPEPTPATDPRIAELESRLAAQDIELGQFRTADEKKQFNAELDAIRALAAAIKTDYGDDTSLGKFGDAVVSFLDKTAQKADAATASTTERDNYVMHRAAMKGSPVINAIYSAVETNPKNADANIDLASISAISAALNSDPVTAKLNQADHYAAIEKKLLARNPGLKAIYYPGLAAAPKAPLAVKAAVATSPATMSEIPGGTSPKPSKPLDISGMGLMDIVKFASTATEPEINAIRAQRARRA